MASAFQTNAFQTSAFQAAAAGVEGPAFQANAFQTNAFQAEAVDSGGDEIRSTITRRVPRSPDNPTIIYHISS